MSDQNVYEMLWDCKFCGTEKLLAKSQKFCPVCGAAQDPATRYFPSDEEKVAVHDHKYVGADLICGSCGTANSGDSSYCMQCGAPLENAERAQLVEDHQVRADGDMFISSGPRDLAKERMEEDLERAAAVQRKKQSEARRPLIIGGIIVGVIAIIGVIAFLLSTTEAGVIVTGHSWERTINIEDYGPRSESSWRDQVPVNYNAGSMSCTQRQRSTNRIPDGEECTTRRVDQGDGTFREERQCTTKYREEPVYDDWCSYTVNRWAFARSVAAQGSSLSEVPTWPDANIVRPGDCIGCEREGGREDTYIVYLKATDSDKTYQCEFDQEKWQGLPVESIWQMDVRRTGQPLCDTLTKPA